LPSHVLYIYIDSITKPSKHFEKGERRKVEEWKYNGKGEFVQSTQCACMEISQQNSLILLMYANAKIK
jgi:hypothetical protein